MRISDWISDVCSSDLPGADLADIGHQRALRQVARDGIRNGDGLRKDRLPHVLPVARERHLDVADPARGGELQIDCLLGFEVRVEAVEVTLPDIGTIRDQARLLEFAHGWKSRAELARRYAYGKHVGRHA